LLVAPRPTSTTIEHLAVKQSTRIGCWRPAEANLAGRLGLSEQALQGALRDYGH
jgi:hypothetical protein